MPSLPQSQGLPTIGLKSKLPALYPPQTSLTTVSVSSTWRFWPNTMWRASPRLARPPQWPVHSLDGLS